MHILRSYWVANDRIARRIECLPILHCEEQSDEAISWFIEWLWNCFVGLWPPDITNGVPF
jgi:hypothetical protein